jgi:hypothetical protein
MHRRGVARGPVVTGPTYGDHLSRAARYAALALSSEPPDPDQLPLLAVLRDDVVDNLAALVRDLAHLDHAAGRPHSVVMLARDPVGALAARLRTLPRLGAGWEDRPSPSQRYDGRPDDPSRAETALDAWRGLAVETLLTRDTLRRHVMPLPDTARWTALGDVAVLAEAVDGLDDIFVDASAHGRESERPQWRKADAALALEAREAAGLARGARDDQPGESFTRLGRLKVQPVSRLDALPVAVTRLGELLRDAGPHATAAGFLSAAVALAHASLAAGQALAAAARHPKGATPQVLLGTATALHTYGTTLQAELARVGPRLASIHRETGSLRHQASEIGGEGARRIRDLVPRPAAALAASPDLLEFAYRLPPVTNDLADTVEDVDRAGRLFVFDRSQDANRGWVPSRNVAPTPLIDALRRAATVAASAPPAPRGWAPPPPASAYGAVIDLRDALDRRRAAARPARPGVPVWDNPRAPKNLGR